MLRRLVDLLGWRSYSLWSLNGPDDAECRHSAAVGGARTWATGTLDTIGNLGLGQILERGVWLDVDPFDSELAALATTLGTSVTSPALVTFGLPWTPDRVPDDLIQTVAVSGRGILAGLYYAGRGIASGATLTEREWQTLQLAADGMTIVQIAATLGVAPTTTKTHFERIYSKLEVRDRAGAVAQGFRWGSLR